VRAHAAVDVRFDDPDASIGMARERLESLHCGAVGIRFDGKEPKMTFTRKFLTSSALVASAMLLATLWSHAQDKSPTKASTASTAKALPSAGKTAPAASSTAADTKVAAKVTASTPVAVDATRRPTASESRSAYDKSDCHHSKGSKVASADDL
jgi:hypothetical protein